MPERNKSYGEDYRPTLVDKFGVWLSQIQVKKWVGKLEGKRVGDFGCGYHAVVSRTLLKKLKSLTVVDLAVSPTLQTLQNVKAIEAHLPQGLSLIPSESFDVILCLSVLEHLSKPEVMLSEIHRLLSPGGKCLLNVPSWRGKHYLELSAFKLGLSPAEEMDDHKMYYDVRDIWPMMIRAGFRPSHIKCFSHKFGLNTFAVGEKAHE